MSILHIYSPNEEVRELMRKYAKTRRVTDSGFDIPLVKTTASPVEGSPIYCIEQNVFVAATNESGECQPCLLLPRSSLSKTTYRLANSIGLIDAGYRGEVKAMVDLIGYPSEIHYETRLFQLVAHNFLPWKNIRVVNTLEELPNAPDGRGEGGFGSTGGTSYKWPMINYDV